MFFPVSVLGVSISLWQDLWWERQRSGGIQPRSWGSQGVFCGAVSMHNSALSVCVQLLKIVIWNPTASLWFLPLLNII